jgi:hypothetical protein
VLFVAFDIAHCVGNIQDSCDRADGEVANGKTQERNHAKNDPYGSEKILRGPKYPRINFIWMVCKVKIKKIRNYVIFEFLLTVFDCFEVPFFFAIFTNGAPPPKSDQNSTCDVLYGPEIKSTQRNYKNVTNRFIVRKESKENVHDQGCYFESELENAGNWMGGLLQKFWECCVI